MLVTVSQLPSKNEGQLRVNSLCWGSVSETAINWTTVFSNCVINCQSFRYVLVYNFTNMYAMSHRSDFFQNSSFDITLIHFAYIECTRLQPLQKCYLLLSLSTFIPNQFYSPHIHPTSTHHFTTTSANGSDNILPTTLYSYTNDQPASVLSCPPHWIPLQHTALPLPATPP
jgi:hypothetical protein